MGAPLEKSAHLPREDADGVAERAEAAEDDSGAMLARASAHLFRTYSGDRRAIPELEALCLAAQPLEEERGDPRRLGLLWRLFTYAANWRMKNDQAFVAAEEALRYYRLAGDSPSDILHGLAWSLILGTRPADEGLRALDAIAVDMPPGSTDLGRAVLLAMLGSIDEAWQLADARSDHLREMRSDSYAGDEYLDLIATIEGDRERALRHTAASVGGAPPGSEGVMASSWLMLARDLWYFGRFEEAERWLRRAQAVESGPAREAQASAVEALLLAARGELEQAEPLARSAAAVAELETETVWFQCARYEDLATVLERAGRIDEAREALERALAVMERKRCLPIARRLREQIDSLGRTQV